MLAQCLLLSMCRDHTEWPKYAHKQQCVSVCVCVACVESEISAVCLGGLFVLISSLLLSAPMLPPFLCSKDKFGRFAKFITFHLQIPTPPSCHPSSTASSSFSRPPHLSLLLVPVLICRSSSLCPTPIRVGLNNRKGFTLSFTNIQYNLNAFSHIYGRYIALITTSNNV